jgi:hypothetical protein
MVGSWLSENAERGDNRMLWTVVIVLVVFLVIAAVWGVLHLRHSQKVAVEAIGKLGLDDIGALRAACEAVFKQAFGETLALEDYEGSARLLSARLDKVESLKRAFARPDFYWYFVLPTGAYLGELLRVHVRGQWQPSAEGGLEIRVPVGDGVATTYPFEKILKQATIGGKGDLYAYLMSATQLERALDEAG